MFAKTRSTLVSAMVLFVLVVSAVMTVPALADDETPPPDAPVVTEPGNGSTDLLAPDAADVGSAPVEETGSAPAALPEGTVSVILDENGDAVPLATQQAAEIIASVDPIWCPTGVTPVLGPACSASFGDLALLVATFVPTGNGVIWIQNGADSSGGAIVIDGAGSWSPAKNFSLTLKGGWSGTLGTTTTNPLTPSIFSQTISITNWQADVTVSDILFSSVSGGVDLNVDTTKNIALARVSTLNNPAGAGAILNNTAGTGNVTVTSSEFKGNAVGSGLSVSSKGLVTLTGVNANSNSQYGAYIDNTGGVGKVTITSSQFNLNTFTSLEVLSHGLITVSNVAANGSLTGDGATLDNTGALTLQGVVLSVGNTFDDNFYSGLRVYTEGSITGNDLSANGNGTSGALGNGALLSNDTAGTPQPVTLTGTNIFGENYESGLMISSVGAIKLNNVHANANVTQAGARVFNNGGTAQPVTLTGSSTFNFNTAYGLSVVSKGAITINNVTANSNLNNTGAGVSLVNNIVGLTAAVTVTGTNFFNDNYTHGLEVISNGTISVANLNGSGNGAAGSFGYGASLVNTGPLTPKNITVSGTNFLNQNYSGGLEAASTGVITVNNLNASGNTNGKGAILNNVGTSAQAVKLTGVNNLSDNYDAGLYVTSSGAISVNSINASGNGLLGSLDYGVYLYNAGATPAQGITLTGTNTASNNWNSGLYAESNGTIAVHSLTAGGNGLVSFNGKGAEIYNHNLGNTAGVTVSGTNLFADNYEAGLYIYTRGTVALSNIISRTSQSGSGLYVDNLGSGSLTPKNITVSGTNLFEENFYNGLELESYGAITLNNVSSIRNGVPSGYGAFINNSGGTIAKDVVLTGTNTFNDNYYDGLWVQSRGAIKVNNLTANGNDASGATLDNHFGLTWAGITLSGANHFNDNKSHGLYVTSYGIFLASNLSANANGGGGSGYGAYITNAGGSTTKTATLSGLNSFDGNKNGGLFLASWGAITASGLNASNNLSSDGVYLHNDLGASTASITITGVGVFNNNNNNGLALYSNGTIAVNTTSITAKSNGVGAGIGYGVDLANYLALSPKAITIKGSSTLLGNYSGGLRVSSDGNITAGNLNASGSTNGFGAELSNTSPGAVGSITLTGTNTFDSNATRGLRVLSLGAISVNSITATDNGNPGGFGGAELDNSAALTPQAVKLTGTNAFNSNDMFGLYVSSIGAITANNLTANDNANSLGVQLANNNFSAVAAVTLTGTNVFNNNYSHGLLVTSYGAVNLNNVTANDNGSSPGAPSGYGALIVNSLAGTAQAVKLSGTNAFNSNYSGGLQVTSKGAITVNNLTASNSLNGIGAELLNVLGTADVTLTGFGALIGNFTDGLNISSQGNVNLTKITADGNGQAGLFVGTTGNVTLTCGSVTANGADGVYVSTPLTLKLIGLVSSGNAALNTHLVGGGTLVVVRNCPLP